MCTCVPACVSVRALAGMQWRPFKPRRGGLKENQWNDLLLTIAEPKEKGWWAFIRNRPVYQVMFYSSPEDEAGFDSLEEEEDSCSSDEEEQEDATDYCKGKRIHLLMNYAWIWLLVHCRRLPSSQCGWCVQPTIQGDQETRLGTFLNCLAMLGR